MTAGTAFTMAGYLIGGLAWWWAARQQKVDTEGMVRLLLVGFVCGVAGARLSEWVLGPEHAILTHPDAFLDPSVGGRTLVGGIACGWLGVEMAKKRLGIRRSTGDLFAVALPAGEVFGRIGCYFNGCCYGIVSSVPWAVYQHGAWRHPSQLYMAALALATLLVVLYYRPRLQAPGDVFKLYIGLYAASRLMVEFYRDRPVVWDGLSLVQLCCGAVLVVLAAGIKREGGLAYARL